MDAEARKKVLCEELLAAHHVPEHAERNSRATPKGTVQEYCELLGTEEFREHSRQRLINFTQGLDAGIIARAQEILELIKTLTDQDPTDPQISRLYEQHRRYVSISLPMAERLKGMINSSFPFEHVELAIIGIENGLHKGDNPDAEEKSD